MGCSFQVCLVLFVFVNYAQNARIGLYDGHPRLVREVYEDVDEGDGDQNLEATTRQFEPRFGRHWPSPFHRHLELPRPFDRNNRERHEPHQPKRFDFHLPYQPREPFDHPRGPLLPPYDPFLMPSRDFNFKPWHDVHDHHKLGHDQGCDHDHGRFPWEGRNVEKKPWKGQKKKKPEENPIETTTPEATTTDVPDIDLRYDVGDE